MNIVKNLCSTIIAALLVAVLAANCYILFAKFVLHDDHPQVLGYSTAVVISGSMSGSIEVNDMVVIHAQDTYTVGDVVTYHSGNHLVTHRIVDTMEEAGETIFITKGDANNSIDLHPVQQDQMVGKVIWVVPQAGTAIQYLQTPLGMTILVFVGMTLLWLPWLQRNH